MIDPHVHLRDGKQSDKETVLHGLTVAWKAGLNAVFEMPNTDPPLTSEFHIRNRINLADSASIPVFHGVYAGLSADPAQIRQMVRLHADLFPRIVGFKMFAGRSTGNLAIVDEGQQRRVFLTLAEADYRGVLAVHCEKESLMNDAIWNPSDPVSHARARPPEAEVGSVADMIRFSGDAGYRGTLHICHVSVAEAVETIAEARDHLSVTCGVTPHHLLLSETSMAGKGGVLLKMNPPLRSENNRLRLVTQLKDRLIDWVETDHAPHTYGDKQEKGHSGIPGFPIYPHLLRWLRTLEFSDQILMQITHGRISDVFGFAVPSEYREADYDLMGEYEFDPYEDCLKNGILRASSD